MNCCFDFDYEVPEFINISWRKARKQHKCCECGSVISQGEDYEYTSGKWGTIFDTMKTCEKCANLRESLMNVACPTYYNLVAEYFEYLRAIGAEKYDEDKDEYYFVPKNHLTCKVMD